MFKRLALAALFLLPFVHQGYAAEADMYWQSSPTAPTFQPVTSENPLPVTGSFTPSGIQATNVTQVLGSAISLTNGLFITPTTGAVFPVTGTFFQATQPISAASLPLPTGAATSANQITGSAYGNAANFVQGSSGAVTNTAQTTIITAPASNKLYITGLQCANSGATTATITLNDTSTWVGINPAGGGGNWTFNTPLVVGTTTALKWTPGGSSTSQFCSAQGYNAP